MEGGGNIPFPLGARSAGSLLGLAEGVWAMRGSGGPCTPGGAGSIPARCDGPRPLCFPGSSPGLACLAFRRPSICMPCCSLSASWEPRPQIVAWKRLLKAAGVSSLCTPALSERSGWPLLTFDLQIKPAYIAELPGVKLIHMHRKTSSKSFLSSTA